MTNDRISMPGGFGGLMRYDEEYSSKFMITPAHVMVFLATIVTFVVCLKLFWPIA
jgi:preprotein translocase subunit Sec61beta